MKLSKYDLEQLHQFDAQDSTSYHEKMELLAKFDPQLHPGKSKRQIGLDVYIYMTSPSYRYMMYLKGAWDHDVPPPPSKGRLFYSDNMFIIIAPNFSPLRAFADGQISRYKYFSSPYIADSPTFTWGFR